MKNSEKSKNITFYSISVKKMFWCTILSLGFYQLYWFYKNWQAIRFFGKFKINSVLRGWILPMFYVFPLFFTIKKKISPTKFTSFCLWIAPLLFVFDLFLSLTFSLDEFTLTHVFYWFLLELTILITTAFLMSVIQRAINKYNSFEKEQKNKMTVGEIITILTLPLFFVLSFIQSYNNALHRFNDITSLTDPQKFLVAVNFKHMVSYPSICKKHGYTMKFYRQAFIKEFEKEYEILDEKLLLQKSDITKEWDKLPQNVINFINEITIDELHEMQNMIIKTSTAAMGNPIQTEKIPAELKNILTIKDACKAIDYQADKIFKSNINQKKAISEKIKEL